MSNEIEICQNNVSPPKHGMGTNKFVENLYKPGTKNKYTLVEETPKLDKRIEMAKPKQSFSDALDAITTREDETFVSPERQERLWSNSVRHISENAQELQKLCLTIVSSACGGDINTLDKAAKLVKILPEHVRELPLPERQKLNYLLHRLEDGEWPLKNGMKDLRRTTDNSVVPVEVPDKDGIWHGLWQDAQGSMKLAYGSMKRLDTLIKGDANTQTSTKLIIEEANRCALQLEKMVEKLDRLSLCKELDWTECDARDARYKKARQEKLSTFDRQRQIIGKYDGLSQGICGLRNEINAVVFSIESSNTNKRKGKSQEEKLALREALVAKAASIETAIAAIRGQCQKLPFENEPGASSTTKEMLRSLHRQVNPVAINSSAELAVMCRDTGIDTKVLKSKANEAYFVLDGSYAALRALAQRQLELTEAYNRIGIGQYLPNAQP